MPSDFQLFIDGQLTEAADGRAFETVDPSTGRPHATVARAAAPDVARAVGAARAAFDDGRWSGLKPERRALRDLLPPGPGVHCRQPAAGRPANLR